MDSSHPNTAGIPLYEIVQMENVSICDEDFEVSNRVCITSLEAEAKQFLLHHERCKIIVHHYYPYQALPKKC